MSRKIVITIDNDGETTVEAVGHKGGTCVKATQPLTQALIGTPTTSVKKPEFYQADNAQRQQEKH
jgi:hypothetical protein